MKERIVTTFGIVIIVAGIVFGAFGIKKCWEEEKAGEEYEEIKEQVVLPIPEIESEEEKEVVIPIDFGSLTAEYPDVYAWIRIPGTGIDYPIAQRAGDNSYYLTHTIDGKKRIAGAIYTEDYNTKEFTDPNTVIYGHNMRNGSMFKQLHKFKSKQFFADNQEVLIYQPNRILHYKIFAAYTYDNRHLIRSFAFADETAYQSYLNEVFKKARTSGNLDTDVQVTSENQIITLSTCTGNDSQRYLVQAVLLSIEEKQ